MELPMGQNWFEKKMYLKSKSYRFIMITFINYLLWFKKKILQHLMKLQRESYYIKVVLYKKIKNIKKSAISETERGV